jgi:serine/threonine protein kinase
MTSPQLKNRANYEILDPLGGGAFGTVYKIKVHADQKMYALKNVELVRPEALAEAKMEYDLLRKGIPNVLKSFGSYHEPNKKFIFSTELMEITLEKHIQGKGPLDFGRFVPIFKDILRGKIIFIFPEK